MEALLIIDYTNDFVATDGALTCGEPGQAIANRIVELANEHLAAGNAVILPTDLHEENDPLHPETALFPPHNLADTWGREFYGPLADWVRDHQDDANVYVYPKNRYSSFANTNLDNYLRSRRITSLHLTGVCTDICVLHTATDGYNLDYDLTVHADAVASFSPSGHDWALQHFQNSMGATVTSRDV
ncbi:cysteine hydrolase family protein [Weissella tructae]|uniref:Isochorismatase n=2 Tax=Weissella TaxID=46255 RepID=A0A075U7R0_9LACO|nr:MULTISPECIES: isochorismatase family cysteine hydrolase [Weissella]AIG66142.1 Isochorismatase [Weissella tructae]AIM63524.1 Isochorismatase [Weissella ceti]AIM64859.1 Isochorismatase [Weissella ceti]ELA07516.1 hydrolase isocharismatase/nicotinamidase [Weissella ceti NC36]QVV91292.1 cysteine hydrolase [Weissella tructae]